MEARRTFDGARSYRQLWIILGALLVAACLAVAGAFVTSGMGSAGVSKPPVIVHPAPGTVLNQDSDRGKSNAAPSITSPKHQQTVF